MADQDKTRQRLIVAAFIVACGALGAGIVAFPEWAAFVSQLIGLS